LGMAFFVYSY